MNADLNNLLLIKYIFDAGDSELSKHNEYSPGLAISHFQDAVELLTWAIAKAVGAENKSDKAFEAAWDMVKTAPGANGRSLPLRNEMKELNKARITFKHFGVMIAQKTADRHFVYASDFLQQASVLFFGINVLEFSRIDSIHNIDARNFIKAAEVSLAAGNVGDTLLCCAKAFRAINDGIEWHVEDPILGDTDADVLEKALANNPVVEKMQNSLYNLRAIVISTSTNMPYVDYRRFKSIIPHANLDPVTGEYYYVDFTRLVNHRESDLIDAKFAFRYILDFALATQGMFVGE